MQLMAELEKTREKLRLSEQKSKTQTTRPKSISGKKMAASSLPESTQTPSGSENVAINWVFLRWKQILLFKSGSKSDNWKWPILVKSDADFYLVLRTANEDVCFCGCKSQQKDSSASYKRFNESLVVTKFFEIIDQTWGCKRQATLVLWTLFL